jgi:predicted RNase H-like nuclease (RuvC/YqgF family)
MKNFVAYVRSMLKRKAFINVFAEGTDPNDGGTDPQGGQQDPPAQPQTQPQADPQPSGTVNFEDLIAKARKDERDKLYGEINKLKEKNNSLLLVIQDRDNKIVDLEKQVGKLDKDYKKVSKDLEDGTKTNKTVSELTATISTLERQLEELQVQYESDVNSLKLNSYKKEQIASAGGEIIPELVTGNTEEEITASIELAKQRYAEITQRAVQGVQIPRANPSATQIQLGADLSMDQIAQTTTKDWAEMRKKLGLK